MPRAKVRTPELRDRVLRVALRQLDGEGVGGFTTRRIAAEAQTSTPAVYELFGDRAGLVRAMFFEGFRVLARRLDRVADSEDPRDDVLRIFAVYRRFVREHPALAELMFSRPFADFDPGPAEQAAGAATRTHVVRRVQRCIDAGRVHGDATDVAHALLALAQGLSAQECAGWLGTSRASVNRRWAVALQAMLDGLAPRDASPARSRGG
jgi:AcrR family transcriptional regulator